MGELMTFPSTLDEFLEQYKIVDKDFVPVEKIVERIEKETPPHRSKLKKTATNLEEAMEALSSKVYDISFVVEEVKEEYHQLTKEQTDKLIDLMLHLMAELNISKAKAADVYKSVADIVYGKDK